MCESKRVVRPNPASPTACYGPGNHVYLDAHTSKYIYLRTSSNFRSRLVNTESLTSKTVTTTELQAMKNKNWIQQ